MILLPIIFMGYNTKCCSSAWGQLPVTLPVVSLVRVFGMVTEKKRAIILSLDHSALYCGL